jgi:hypothetical protein
MPTTTNNPSGATQAWRLVVKGYEEALKVGGLPEHQRESLERQLQATREILGLEPAWVRFEDERPRPNWYEAYETVKAGSDQIITGGSARCEQSEAQAPKSVDPAAKRASAR